MGRADSLVACLGCGGEVADVTGPTHPYMLASPGCWQLYGHWMAEHATASVPGMGTHHVDCYAVQHPDGGDDDRRQRQSVAIHLVALCMRLERDTSPEVAIRVRARALEVVPATHGFDDWPLLEPPERRGAITIVDVARAQDDLGAVFRRWAEDSWAAWEAHHPTVRAWADAVVRAL